MCFGNGSDFDYATIKHSAIPPSLASWGVQRSVLYLVLQGFRRLSDSLNGTLIEGGKRSAEPRHVAMVLVKREQHAIGLSDDLLPLHETPETGIETVVP